MSYQAVTDIHKVSKSILQRLVTGGVSMSAFNAGKQRLTSAEERVVVDFCLESADRGFPLTHDNVYNVSRQESRDNENDFIFTNSLEFN